MKNIFFLTVCSILLIGCQTIRVVSDYDATIDYNQFKTFAFHKSGIDKVDISDLDKKRILNAIEKQMVAKGYTLSEKPDIWVNIITKATEKVYVNQFNYGWGWGWNPWFYGGPNYTTSSSVIEGTLYIDIIDAKKNELIWQGIGEGALTQNPKEKEARINEFVAKILAIYPPQIEKKKN